MVKNNLQFNITKYHGDDVHTMNYGISSMYSGEVTTLRVGESTRWLARVIYPAALYYMNINMGGEHYVTGWGYPSGYYIKEHFKKPNSVIGDPNLQDFTFAMKFILATLVLLSFILASQKISNTFGFLAGITYFVLALSTLLIKIMLSIFYTESSLIILFNLIVALALTKKIYVWRLYIWSALLLAFAISTKLTGTIFIIPIIVLILQKDTFFSKMKIEGFIILTFVFLAIINMYASSYMELLDQTLANVYHLKTGHKLTVPSGMYQLSKIMEALSPWIYLFPIALFILVYRKSKELYFLISISLSSLIMIAALIGVSFFLSRNLTTPLVMMILIISVGFNYLINHIKFKPQIMLSVSIVSILLIHLFTIDSNLLDVNYEVIQRHIKGSKNIAIIDMEEDLVDAYSVLESMPETFTLVNDLAKFKEQFWLYDCVVIKRTKNNKHYTNYILPLDFQLIARHGNYFIFKKKNRAITLHKKRTSLKKTLLLKSAKFDIHLKDNILTFTKRNVSEEDLKDIFILHLYPEKNEDLPKERQQYKFENLDFNASLDSIFDGYFLQEIALPTYPIQFIELGQLGKKGVLWKEKIKIGK
jgi:hypothetical protein